MINHNPINEGIQEYKNHMGAVLIDVRTQEEYQDGHIENAINIPVQEIEKIKDTILDVSTPIYSYCLSGQRSFKACFKLKEMGYTNVKNIGGINMYKGPIV
ncbi:MAG: rhodanese-like domain-containing protein [Erysipelotrichaceae bacterium]|uniref:rhodanese-like domain-containing protein n=1 Tax=Floccifex sp. TaxID=2815810 RepID=UPI002A74DE69|nr:rhodanese-like domain-containing protein [Floccifex sp.]MDD7280629.1 rhodanese-like domain-containing protein [Erysipelotrichaceae bacterium]MDY2957712.1 rhodanese-like domain-containing protein [Floccifex sp.]